jgi:CMP/dCMP kinase
MIIAVDGPSASGKGTLARALATALGFHFLDTGTLYRMVGLAMLRADRDEHDEVAATAIARALEPATYEDHELRSEHVASMASRVAQIPDVRAALLQFQRDFAKRKPGSVLDGRDIGTVICPDADLKFFVTARQDVRAQRRHKDLPSASYEAVLADITARDARDAHRTLRAEDAILIDTSDETVEALLAKMLKNVEQKSSVA